MKKWWVLFIILVIFLSCLQTFFCTLILAKRVSDRVGGVQRRALRGANRWVFLRCRAERARRRIRISVSFFIYIYLFICLFVYWSLVADRVGGAQRRVSIRCRAECAHRIVFLHLLCFSPLQWLTRDFKYETFRDQWIPLNSESEVSMREQGQRRLQARKEWPRTDLIHINCKRVCKIA